MHERKRYSPGGALFALAILIVLQGSDEQRPTGATAHLTGPAVHQTDTLRAYRHALPGGQPALRALAQPPSWVF